MTEVMVRIIFSVTWLIFVIAAIIVNSPDPEEGENDE